MSKTKGTKYFGWENVPEGVLVRTDHSKGREFYLKLPDGDFQSFCSWISGGDQFEGGYPYNPDHFTTGVYKALH